MPAYANVGANGIRLGRSRAPRIRVKLSSNFVGCAERSASIVLDEALTRPMRFPCLGRVQHILHAEQQFL